MKYLGLASAALLAITAFAPGVASAQMHPQTQTTAQVTPPAHSEAKVRHVETKKRVVTTKRVVHRHNGVKRHKTRRVCRNTWHDGRRVRRCRTVRY